MLPTVSVVVPVKDDPRLLDCVASILALRDECGVLQVIVADNGSRPAFEAILAGLPAEVTLLRVPQPGAYAARNRALDAATGDAIFFTDGDCIIQPGWFDTGLAALGLSTQHSALSTDVGLSTQHSARSTLPAEIAQGFSGSASDDPIASIVQSRYEAHLEGLAPGAPTECDTRNLAVRREVFDTLRFNEAYRRVGDTEFGLAAEAAGFRVAYCPAMRVEHSHEADLALFVAKQVCHGWGAQRLMHEQPGLPWHGGHLRLAERFGPRLRRIPGHRLAGAGLAHTAILLARALQRLAPRLPQRVASSSLGAFDKLGGLAGHAMFAPNTPEPSPSRLLRRQLDRD